MSVMQRNKGKAGERELAAAIHAVTGWEVRRFWWEATPTALSI